MQNLSHQVTAINEAACDLAREVADEGDGLVAGGVCQTPTYLSGKGKEACQVEFKKQLAAFIKKDVDFLIAEVCVIYSSSLYAEYIRIYWRY